MIEHHPYLFFGCLLVAGYLTWGLILGWLDARQVIRQRDLPGLPMSRREKLEAAYIVILITMLLWPVLGLDIIDDEDDDQGPEA